MAKVDYACTRCGKEHPRSDLVAKVASFRELGVGGRLVRSRTVAWLCENCMVYDPDYNMTRVNGPDAESRRTADATPRRS